MTHSNHVHVRLVRNDGRVCILPHAEVVGYVIEHDRPNRRSRAIVTYDLTPDVDENVAYEYIDAATEAASAHSRPTPSSTESTP